MQRSITESFAIKKLESEKKGYFLTGGGVKQEYKTKCEIYTIYFPLNN